MQSKFKRLGKDSIVYGVGGVVTRFIGFLLLPIYTRVFSPTEYGIMDLIATMVALGGIILTAGTETALSYYFFKLDSALERRKTVTSTAVYLISINVLVALIVWLAAEQISKLVFGEGPPAIYLRVAVLSIPCSSLLSLNLNIFRLNRRPWSYVAISSSQLLLTVSLNIYLVVIEEIGVIGVFWTNLIASALFAIFSSVLNWQYFSLKTFTWTRLGQIVQYGFPLVVGGLSMWAINSLDRYFLLHFSTIEDVGLYSVGLRVASVAGFATWAFRLANAPFQFEVSSEPDAIQVYSRTLSYFVLVASTLCVLLALFARPLLRILTTDAYLNAHVVVGLAGFSAAMYGTYQIVGVGLLLTRRTGFTGAAIGVGSLLDVGFLLIFVPWFGMVGAALAVLSTHVSVAIMLYWAAQRAYRISYDLSFVARVTLPAGFIVLLGSLITTTDYLGDLLVAIGLFAGFLMLMILLGVIDPQLLRFVTKALKNYPVKLSTSTRLKGESPSQ